MSWNTGTSGWTALALSASVLFAPTALGVNYVVDDLDGNDGNGGISATGGENDLPGLDFSDAFKTIGKATSVAIADDFIFVKHGEYSEGVVATSGTTLIAVGEVVIANVSTGLLVNAVFSGLIVDGFTIKNCQIGVRVNGGPGSRGVVLKNFTISSCETGAMFPGADGVNVVRWVITDCSGRGISMVPGALTIEQCSIVGNAIGVDGLGAAGHIFRNNIVAFNTIDGIVGGNGGLVDFNDVFGNGPDGAGPDNEYTGVTPGPNDIMPPVDPQFVDLARRILHLKPTSPLVNAGEKLGGGPIVSIGAREIGFANSQNLNMWADWMDSSGNALAPCSSSTADVCIEPSGHIILNPGLPAVTRATVISRIYGGSLKSVEFAAVEDLTQPSGMRKVIDANDTTLQRELEFRGSDALFGATAPNTPPLQFVPIFEGQVLESSFRFVQVRMTLTTDGK